MEKVKWGVLGTANIARGCTIPGMLLAENCELYAIAGRSIEKAEKFKDEFGFQKAYGSYEELLDDEDVQAVYIPLPNGLHFKWVKAALEKKKNVLCEKPMALNANDAKELFKTAEENNVVLMEAYAYLHSPYVKSLKEDVQSGIIGTVDYIESAFHTQGYKEDIRLYKDQGGGAMYDLGCYCTTMILSLIDSKPALVKAVAEFSDLGVDYNTAAIIRFENGVRASFNVGMILGENTNSRFDRLYIHGDKGSIRSDV
ncbi:MAG: Gfo/Idh/MocA family oxidoreductase, partial [Lachnospiraceae bacterium]|nr:Gfo/Idh/MocA family oxidoreductase [Lachnospiraceae bacterium]